MTDLGAANWNSPDRPRGTGAQSVGLEFETLRSILFAWQLLRRIDARRKPLLRNGRRRTNDRVLNRKDYRYYVGLDRIFEPLGYQTSRRGGMRQPPVPSSRN